MVGLVGDRLEEELLNELLPHFIKRQKCFVEIGFVRHLIPQ